MHKNSAQSTREIEELQEQLSALRSELGHAEREMSLYKAQLEAVLASRSWRITQPIRAVSRMTRHAAEAAALLANDAYMRLPAPLRAALDRLVHAGASRVDGPGANTSHTIGVLPVDYGLEIAAFTDARPENVEFTHPPVPSLSIVIVAGEDKEAVLRMLGALHRQEGIESAELIVLARDVEEMAQRVKGVRLERASGALGQDYARGAMLASSTWVLFLSAHCRPLANLLAELHRLVSEQRDVGLVGPKLVSEEGQLVFPVSRVNATDPNAPEVNFLRRIDRCPAVGFAVKRALVAPADTRLAVAEGWMSALVDAARQENLRVVYSPFVHALVSRELVRGTISAPLPKFFDRLGHVLIVDQHTPTPDRDSGSVDAFFQMKVLVELGYRVTFLATVDATYVRPYTADLQRIGVECLYPPYVASITHHLRECGSRYGYVVLTRLPVAHDCMSIVRRYCRRAIVVFNTVDLHFLREQRHAELTRDDRIAGRARETRRQELTLMRNADATLVISEIEAELLRQEVPEVRTLHLPLIMDIADRRDTPFTQRKDVFFIGGFRHEPNRDAVFYLIRDIWPLVRARLPQVRLHIVGAGVPPEMLEFAAPDIAIHGYVPDAGRFFNGCRLSVAPLRFGAGVKGKVGRSLGYGCPVVLSPVAAEGIGIADGVNALVAGNAGEFADAVARLYQDETLWTRLSREGREFFDTHFSYEVGKERLASIMTALQPAAMDRA